MIRVFSVFFVSVFLFPSYGAKKGDIVIINSNKNKVQTITAPALVPSRSKRLRSAREDAEINTESAIIQKLEVDRLKAEQKRYNKFFLNHKSKSSSSVSETQKMPTYSDDHHWFNRAFVSFGLGAVQYPGVENINSLDKPTYFFSFGGYDHGNFIFELSLYYSEHFILPVTEDNNNNNIREGVSQPAVSMSTKYSPLKGRIKPYLGVSGTYIARRWFILQKTGEVIGNANPEEDIAIKRWRQSVNAGITTGADIGLGNKLGLNIGITYNWNIYTETRDTQLNDRVQILDERDSVVLSGSLRYYF